MDGAPTQRPAWIAHAEALFGPDFGAALADVAQVSRKTIQRAVATGALPRQIEPWLAETVARVPADAARGYGAALRAAVLAGGAAGPEALRLVQEDITALRLPWDESRRQRWHGC